MKKNMGTFDQIFRIIVAITVCVLYYNDVISGTLAIVLGILAIVFFLTSMLGSCPLYTIFGINTSKIKKV